ncbi:DUF423 domain-containing protein [Endozoicomonas sp. G2_1]|uniref:DUF423 domain-containing protein n=1 Tax=Endozoicomonas sp. G2_1 TaxID=2821091 RepID=UPI001ADBAC16|nr:DUF423 domain-containing protein [Endozoicomonas sp. G2_1]MBO9488915.1 DUF423 domain-containing protein [Endozoicomonas sp. G2_1]
MNTANISSATNTDVIHARYGKISAFLVFFVSVSGAFSVLFGAWLAHGGQSLAAELLFRLEQAHSYQFLHTLALAAAIIAYRVTKQHLWLIPALGFCLGMLLFCGSLYFKTLLDIAWLSKFAPFGGLTLAIAWLTLAIPLLKTR